MFDAVSVMRRALARLRPDEGESAMVDWGDPEALAALLSPHGEVEIAEHLLAHEPVSPQRFWDRWERLHPMWIAARGQLEQAGEWEAVRESAIAALHDGGFDEGAQSPWLLAVLTRR